MRNQPSTRPRASARLPLCAALIAALLAAAPAAADTSHATHAAEPTPTRPTPAAADEHAGMTADEHTGAKADEQAGANADEHAGMTADEHAGMQPADKSEGAQAGHGGHDAGGAVDRPIGLLLGGFGVVNALALAAAVVLRRRGPAAKRRATLARVRATAGAPTVARAPTVEPPS